MLNLWYELFHHIGFPLSWDTLSCGDMVDTPTTATDVGMVIKTKSHFVPLKVVDLEVRVRFFLLNARMK